MTERPCSDHASGFQILGNQHGGYYSSCKRFDVQRIDRPFEGYNSASNTMFEHVWGILVHLVFDFSVNWGRVCVPTLSTMFTLAFPS